MSTVLRPYLYREIEPIHRTAHARFFVAFQRRCSHTPADSFWSSTSFNHRLAELRDAQKIHEKEGNAFPGLMYPRMLQQSARNIDIYTFVKGFGHLNAGGLKKHRDKSFCVNGRVERIREAGSKLLFVDVVHNDEKLQVMVNLGSIQKDHEYSNSDVRSFRKTIAVGDFYSFLGFPSRTNSGEFSLTASDLPKLLSPSLHTLPTSVSDENTLARFPQLDLLLNRSKRDLLRLRHIIDTTLNSYFNSLGFTRVTTPILGADTGGAVARPFMTTSTAYPSKPLKLRIAQELALKKLVAAGMGRVYEIGPNFRNEGINATHNPEFTTCEFYRPYANLDDLMDMTEDIFLRIHQSIIDQRSSKSNLSTLPDAPFIPVRPFKRIPFLKTLAHSIHSQAPDFRLPRDLSAPNAATEILSLFEHLEMAAPANPTVPRLLDTLSSRFLEPLCDAPTFITHYPAVMSPLAKSFVDAETGHAVAARAELFVAGVEYANMYEEENDPFAQARKFLDQARLLDDDGDDQREPRTAQRELSPGQKYYVKVLEMGLPPTGGWGAGIERLTMLFGGAKRIADVLPFGTLRSVVAMGTEIEGRSAEGKTSR